MELEELLRQNTFSQEVMDDSVEVFSQRLSGQRITKKPSKKARYMLETFEHMEEVLSMLNVLTYCCVFLNSFPKGALWGKTFTRAEYIRYHIESHFKNISGVYDRCLLLVNHVYSIGLASKYVKHDIIINNKYLIGTETKKELIKIHEVLKEINPTRNLVTHRSRFKDEKLDELRMFEFLFKNGDLENEKRNVLKKKIDLSYKAFIPKKIKEIKNTNRMLNIKINSFLTLLEMSTD